MQVTQKKITEAATAADDLQSKLDTMRRAANAAALLTVTSEAHKTEAQQDAARESINFNTGIVRMLADGVQQRAQEIADLAGEIIARLDGETR